MFSKIYKKLKKRYEPKECDGKVLFRNEYVLGAYILCFFVFSLMGLFFLLLSFADSDFVVMGAGCLIFGLLFIGFLRLCETVYILDQDHLEIYVLFKRRKIYYRDIKYLYKSADYIVIECGKRAPYNLYIRYYDSSFETYLNKYLRCCNQKIRKTVPSSEELRALKVDVKTDFYIRRVGTYFVSVVYLIAVSYFAWILHDIDISIQGNLIFLLLMIAMGIALFIGMSIVFCIRYHFTDMYIEQKVFFLTLSRVDIRDISKVTKKEEYVRLRKGGSYNTERIRIYCKEKECFKINTINSAEFYDFSDVLKYFGDKNIEIQELR